MKKLDKYNIYSLSKIIYKTGIMISGNNKSFTKLSEKLILNLQEGYSDDKIKRVLSSELTVTYGLSISNKKIEEITDTIIKWFDL
ncbi:hypothetical protein [Pontimicrobium sp. IMCC45349]|uniref:hypothetical protein n=1 Tax=Pontimicrobium sp. IMCC45349 TaxID=3391574 RepID=UPI0039A3208C